MSDQDDMWRAIAGLREQIRDLSELKDRVTALEQFISKLPVTFTDERGQIVHLSQ